MLPVNVIMQQQLLPPQEYVMVEQVLEYLLNESTGLLTWEQVQNIAACGAIAAAPDGLTWWQDTWDFYLKFEDTVEDWFYDQYGDAWLERFAKNTTSVRGMIHHMVTVFVTQLCKQLIKHDANSRR